MTSQQNASSVYLAFLSRDEFRAKFPQLPDVVEGGYTGPSIATRPGSTNHEDYIQYLHTITLPLPEQLTDAATPILNSILRHELGHGDCGHRFGETRLYKYLLEEKESSDNSDRIKLLGFLPVRLVVRVAESLGYSGLATLHAFDKEERYARRFDRTHAATLNPIRWR